MRQRASQETVPAELRASLLEYARGLVDALSELGVLSPMGRRLPRAWCRPMMLALHEDGSPRRWSRHRDEKSALRGRVAHNRMLVRLEQHLLEEWLLVEHPEPLLILGGAGMGKSILLETFAHLLGHRLLRDLERDAAGGRIGGVPVLVPLRHMPRHGMALRETLLGEEGSLVGRSGSPLGEPKLPRDQLEWLIEHDLLIPLLDGFDELSPLQRDRLIDSTAGVRRFLLASRPDHGAEKWFAPDRVLTLTALSPEECRGYVREVFARSRRVTYADALKWLDESLDGAWGMSLVEPLCLRLWCDYVELRGRPPASPAVLTDLMFEELLERRDVLRRRAPQTPPLGRIMNDRRWLERYVGALGVVFVRHGFEPLGFDHPEIAAVDGRIGIHRDGEQLDGLEALERAGLLIGNLGTATVQLLKLPVVESLIGKHLARSTLEPEGPRGFVELFRRWVWLPMAHRILTETFVELRQGTAEQARLADACCEWLMSVSEHCPLHKADVGALAAAGAVVQDDLAHPFAPLALQLAGHAQSERALRATIAVRLKANRRHAGCNLSILSRVGPRQHLGAMIALVEAHRDQRNADIQRPVGDSIVRLAREVPPSVAHQAMRLGLSAWADESDELLRASYAWLVRESAARMQGGDTVKATIDLLARVSATELDAREHFDLGVALTGVLRRAPEQEVLGLARALMAELGVKPTRRHDALAEALIAASSRVAPHDAPALVDLLVDATATGKAHWRRLDDIYCHALIAEKAVNAAAARVLPEDVGRATVRWVQAFAATGRGVHDSNIRMALANALSQTARYVPPSVAMGLVESLLETVRRLGIDCNGGWVPESLAGAIASIAAVIPEDQAAVAVDRWCGGFKFMGGRVDKAHSPTTRSAVVHTAMRVPEDQSSRVLARWAAASRSPIAQANQSFRVALAWALGGVATRLKSDDVPGAVGELLASLAEESGAWQCPVRDGLETALKVAAARLYEEGGWKVVCEWLGELREASKPGELALAIRIGAGRVRQSDIREAAHAMLRAAADHVDLDHGLATVHLVWAVATLAERTGREDATAVAELLAGVADHDWVGPECGVAHVLAEALGHVTGAIPEAGAGEHIDRLLGAWDVLTKRDGTGLVHGKMEAALKKACAKLPALEVQSVLQRWGQVLMDPTDAGAGEGAPCAAAGSSPLGMQGLLKQPRPKEPCNLNSAIRKTLCDALNTRASSDDGENGTTDRENSDGAALPSLDDLCSDVQLLRDRAPRLAVSEAGDLADMLSRQGRNNEALWVICLHPDLAAVVAPSRENQRYLYECRYRSDESLVLDPMLTCVPDVLRPLVRQSGTSRAGKTRRATVSPHDAPRSVATDPRDVLPERDYFDLLKVLDVLGSWMSSALVRELELAIVEAFIGSHKKLTHASPAQRVHYRVVRTLGVSIKRATPPPPYEVGELLRGNLDRMHVLLSILETERRPPVSEKGADSGRIAPTLRDSQDLTPWDTVKRGYKRACKKMHPELVVARSSLAGGRKGRR